MPTASWGTEPDGMAVAGRSLHPVICQGQGGWVTGSNQHPQMGKLLREVLAESKWGVLFRTKLGAQGAGSVMDTACRQAGLPRMLAVALVACSCHRAVEGILLFRSQESTRGTSGSHPSHPAARSWTQSGQQAATKGSERETRPRWHFEVNESRANETSLRSQEPEVTTPISTQGMAITWLPEATQELRLEPE